MISSKTFELNLLLFNNKFIALLDTDGTGGAVVQSVDQGHPTDPPHS